MRSRKPQTIHSFVPTAGTIAVASLFALLASIVLSGCGPHPPTRAEPIGRAQGRGIADLRVSTTTTTTLPAPLPAAFAAWSASAHGSQVVAHAAPEASSAAVRTFGPLNSLGHDPETFAVFEARRDASGTLWYRVQLPETRPNGTEAWIPADAVSISGHNEKIVVTLSSRTAALYEQGSVVQQWQVGIGKPATPTPVGRFFLWTKWTPAEGSPDAYGPGVLGISAQSEAINSWQGGDPLIGLHGATRSSDLGAAVSHGCIRMPPSITQHLLDTLPLGVPVEIDA